MSADEAVIERDHIFIGPEGNYVFDGAFHQGWSDITRGQPTHFGGAALHIRNPAATTASISLQDSDDGTTWTTLPFSDTASSNMLVKMIVGLGEQTILTQTRRRYLRISYTPITPEGIIVDMSQQPPRGDFVDAGVTS